MLTVLTNSSVFEEEHRGKCLFACLLGHTENRSTGYKRTVEIQGCQCLTITEIRMYKKAVKSVLHDKNIHLSRALSYFSIKRVENN